MNKRHIKAAALIIVLALLLCGCGQGKDDQPAGDKTINMGAWNYFGASDQNPAESWNGWYLSFYGAGETLFKLDKGYNVIPWLVESFSYPEPDRWEFVIRDDVTFTNGVKVTAEEVKKSFDYMMEYTPRGKQTYDFKEIKADGQVLTIITNSPQPTLTTDLCDPLGVVQYISDGIDYANGAIMTGPYVITSFTANERVELEAYDGYWGGAPKVKYINLITYGDMDALTMALQQGEIDLAVMPDYSSLSLFDPDDYTVSMATSTRGQALVFNMESEFGGDIAVRKALAWCMDREGMVANTGDTYAYEYGMFPDIMSFGGIDKLDLEVTCCDLDAARKVLADAGYADTDGDGFVEKDGKKLSVRFVVSTGDPTITMFAQAIQSQAKLIGIDLDLQEYANTSDILAAGDFDVTISSKGYAPAGNPQYFFNSYLVSGGTGNTGHYSNPTVDELAAKLQGTYDKDERDRISIQIIQEAMDDLYTVTFDHKKFYCVYRNGIEGFEAQPSEYYLVDNMIDIH